MFGAHLKEARLHRGAQLIGYVKCTFDRGYFQFSVVLLGYNPIVSEGASLCELHGAESCFQNKHFSRTDCLQALSLRNWGSHSNEVG